MRLRVTQSSTFNRRRGFTLTEIMITVSIVGVLSSIAGSTYSKFFKRAKIAEVYLGLGEIYNAEQAFFVINGYYTVNLNKLMGGKIFDSNSSKAIYGFNPGTAGADRSCGSLTNAECLTSQTMNQAPNVVATDIKYSLACAYGIVGASTKRCSYINNVGYDPRSGPPLPNDFFNGIVPNRGFDVHAVLDLENDRKFDVFGVMGELTADGAPGGGKSVYRVCDNGAYEASAVPGGGPVLCFR